VDFLGDCQGMRKMKGGVYEWFRCLAPLYSGDVPDNFGLR